MSACSYKRVKRFVISPQRHMHTKITDVSFEGIYRLYFLPATPLKCFTMLDNFVGRLRPFMLDEILSCR